MALAISYDEPNDIVTIEGKRYSGDFFRHFAADADPEDKKLFKILKGPQEVTTVRVVTDAELSAAFNRHT